MAESTTVTPEQSTEELISTALGAVANSLKRLRTPEPGDENGDEKRLKTEQEASGPGLDFLEMLENALGSLDEPQAPTSLAVDSHAGPAASATAPDAPMDVQIPARRYPKKMRFSQNPTYLVRSMGLPLLGSLVSTLSCCTRRSQHPVRRALTRFRSLFRYCTHCPNNHETRRLRPLPTPRPIPGRHTSV